MIPKDKTRTTITLSIDNSKKLEELARKMGLSKSALITMWINSNKK